MSTSSTFALPPLLFTRHAQSVENADESLRNQKHTACVGLSEIGCQQLAPLADFYARTVTERHWDELTILVSPYHRCQTTAAPVIKRLEKLGITLHVRTETLLREANSGYYPNKRPYLGHPEWERLRQQANEDDAYQFFVPPGGESLAQTEAIQEVFLNKLACRYPPRGQALICFGHGVAGRVLFKALGERDWDWYQRQPNFPNASVRLFENHTDHGFVFEQSKELFTNSGVSLEAA